MMEIPDKMKIAPIPRQVRDTCTLFTYYLTNSTF